MRPSFGCAYKAGRIWVDLCQERARSLCKKRRCLFRLDLSRYRLRRKLLGDFRLQLGDRLLRASLHLFQSLKLGGFRLNGEILDDCLLLHRASSD